MCITNGPAELSNTRILVIAGTNGRQLTVYQNSADTEIKNAMILPVPTTNGLELVDMTSYKDIFSKLSKYFPTLSRSIYKGFELNSSDCDTLKIHKVGSYQASIVDSLNDFARVDSSFRLNPNVKEILATHYPTFGFIVCQLVEGENDYEPFAYTHHIIDGKVFTPTRHYHGDGPPEKISDWDHEIYTVGCIAPNAQIATKTSHEISQLCNYTGISTNDTILSKIKIIGQHTNYDAIFYQKPGPRDLKSLIADRYLVYTGDDGCKFYSNVEGLTFESSDNATILLYKNKHLQALRFMNNVLKIVGQIVLCYDLGDGFLVQGLVSGNVWTYIKDHTGPLMVLNV